MTAQLLDEILVYFNSDQSMTFSPFNIKHLFEVPERDFYNSIIQLHQEDYLFKLSSGNLSTPENGVYRISPKGILFIMSGGYSAALRSREMINEKIEEKENLELQKLRTEVSLITNQLVDYDKVKKTSQNANWIAILAIIVSLLAIVLELKGCMKK